MAHAADVVREPMVLLLLVCAGMYIAFGDLFEAVILGASVTLVVVISLFQEGKTERALQALKDLSSPQASVRRDGRAVRIRASEVVPGDVLLLQEGDRVAADAVLVSATGLKVNESLLTGESAAVREAGRAGPGSHGAARRGQDAVRLREHPGRLRVGARRWSAPPEPAPRWGGSGTGWRAVSTAENPLKSQLAGLVRAVAVAARRPAASRCYSSTGSAASDWKGGLLAGLTLAISLCRRSSRWW